MHQTTLHWTDAQTQGGLTSAAFAEMLHVAAEAVCEIASGPPAVAL